MNPSPLKTALAYECFQDQDNSTLALPSDQKMKTGTSGRQRVQEQVMMTVKRQKSKSSQSSTLSHSNRGSLYDGLADGYNSYGASGRSSYYSKFQAGNGSWGYPAQLPVLQSQEVGTRRRGVSTKPRGDHRVPLFCFASFPFVAGPSETKAAAFPKWVEEPAPPFAG
uniref:Plakophilin 1 n=1 Tax=Equus caballus TaxID=9796 RepID=A0A9L0R0P6_HORSE